MSDGPYKSLPLDKHWKGVAECAHNDSFSDEERAYAMYKALLNDVFDNIGKDCINSITNILIEQQQINLFSEQAIVEIENIAIHYSQTPLFHSLMEHIKTILLDGKRGGDALVEAFNLTMHKHAKARIRQVEEHYKRDAHTLSEQQKTVSVRDRMKRSLPIISDKNIGEEIIRIARGEALPTRPPKSGGLDDGPGL